MSTSAVLSTAIISSSTAVISSLPTLSPSPLLSSSSTTIRSTLAQTTSSAVRTTATPTRFAIPTFVSTSSTSTTTYVSDNTLGGNAIIVIATVIAIVLFIGILGCCSCCWRVPQRKVAPVPPKPVRVEFNDVRRVVIVRANEDDRAERGEAGLEDDEEQLPPYSPPLPQKAVLKL